MMRKSLAEELEETMVEEDAKVRRRRRSCRRIVRNVTWRSSARTRWRLNVLASRVPFRQSLVMMTLLCGTQDENAQEKNVCS